MRTSGGWIVVAMLTHGAWQVTGNFVVPRLTGYRSGGEG